MRELQAMEVSITPVYIMTQGGRERRRLQIAVKYNGRIFNDTQVLWPSDAMSVLDYCFEVARLSITEAVKRTEADLATESSADSAERRAG